MICGFVFAITQTECLELLLADLTRIPKFIDNISKCTCISGIGKISPGVAEVVMPFS